MFGENTLMYDAFSIKLNARYLQLLDEETKRAFVKFPGLSDCLRDVKAYTVSQRRDSNPGLLNLWTSALPHRSLHRTIGLPGIIIMSACHRPPALWLTTTGTRTADHSTCCQVL